MVEQSTALLQAFAREHLPQLHRPETLQVTFPWQRMFIADIRYDAQN